MTGNDSARDYASDRHVYPLQGKMSFMILFKYTAMIYGRSLGRRLRSALEELSRNRNPSLTLRTAGRPFSSAVKHCFAIEIISKGQVHSTLSTVSSKQRNSGPDACKFAVSLIYILQISDFELEFGLEISTRNPVIRSVESI